MNENGTMMRSLRRELRGREQKLVRLLGQFVRCESPSHQKAAVDRFGGMVASEWRRRGAKVRILRQAKRGNHVRAEIWLGEGRPKGQIMVLGPPRHGVSAGDACEDAVSRARRAGVRAGNI